MRLRLVLLTLMFLSVFTAAKAQDAIKTDQTGYPDLDLITKHVLPLPDFNFHGNAVSA